MDEVDPDSVRTRSASWEIVTSGVPDVDDLAIALGSTTSFSSAPTTSATW
jgi:hypothetical protein